MVRFSGWNVEDSSKKNVAFESVFYPLDKQTVSVLKVFEFEAEKQRMSVIVKID
jgi:magnesium-transporting ATPase (P-type)